MLDERAGHKDGHIAQRVGHASRSDPGGGRVAVQLDQRQGGVKGKPSAKAKAEMDCTLHSRPTLYHFLQSAQFSKQQRHVLSGVGDEILVRVRCTRQIDVVAGGTDEARSAVVVAPLDKGLPWSWRSELAAA